MELDNLVHRCLLFSKSTVTNVRYPSTNAIKTECPFTCDTFRYRQSAGGIRVAIGSASQKSNLYYDAVSKDLIIKKVQSLMGQKLDKLYDKLNFLKISGAFHLWRERSLKSTICKRIRPNSEYKVKVTVANTLWSSHIIKSKKYSVGIILGLFSDHLQTITKRRFLFWKRYARKSRYAMIRYFDKWSVKVSKIILNRMNIIRFVDILNDKINKLLKIKLKNYFITFKKRVDYINAMEKLKFKLMSWKICTHAMAKGRRSQKKYYLEIWKDYLRQQKIERKEKNEILDRTFLRQYWNVWIQRSSARELLKKLFSFRYKLCWVAWTKWKEKDAIIFPEKVLSPERASSTPLSTPRAADLELVDSSMSYEVVHTPIRCSRRKCIACCRKIFQSSTSTSTSISGLMQSRSQLADSYVISSIDRSLIRSIPRGDVLSASHLSPSSSFRVDISNSEFKNWQKSSTKNQSASTEQKTRKYSDPFLRFERDITIIKSTFPDRSLFSSESNVGVSALIDNIENVYDKKNKTLNIDNQNTDNNDDNNHDNNSRDIHNNNNNNDNNNNKNNNDNDDNNNDNNNENKKIDKNLKEIQILSAVTPHQISQKLFENNNEKKIDDLTQTLRKSKMEESFMKRLSMVQKLEKDFAVQKRTFRRKK